MKATTITCAIAFLALLAASAAAQDSKEEDLGNKQYIILKPYVPVLAESFKISDLPVQDTSSGQAPDFSYSLPSYPLETSYETGVIKPVTIKDQPIPKLYRSLLKLGLGIQTTYNGELFVNSLRSSKYDAGLHLLHFSGKPNLSDVGDASFSTNGASLYGKYFVDKFTFTGDLDFRRDMHHYYGFNDIIADEDTYKQIFNRTGFRVGMERRQPGEDGWDYAAALRFATLRDHFEKDENDFTFDGFLSKKFSDADGRMNVSLDYFRKNDAKPTVLNKYHNLGRNIIRLEPSATFRKDRMVLLLGLNFAVEKDLETTAHIYPNIRLDLPVGDNALSFFADVTGRIVKNSYATVTEENPFVNPDVVPVPNTSENLHIEAGLKGQASPGISFGASIARSSMQNMLFFVDDTSASFPPGPATFNIVYDDGSVTTLHAEAGYKPADKLSLSFSFNQYIYKTDHLAEAWHKPANDAAIDVRYNLQDKILAGFTVFFRGRQYAEEKDASNFVTAKKISGFADINLALEYRYSKVLSLFVNMNNLGFSRYYYWNNYPSEKFNILGGIKFAF